MTVNNLPNVFPQIKTVILKLFHKPRFTCVMDTRKQVLWRIKEYATSYGIDIGNELLQYDRRRTGVLSTLSLHRCISNLGLTLTNHEIQSLVIAYQAPGGVDIHRLIKDINDSARPEDLSVTRLPPCVDELSILAHELESKQTNLREALRQYDPLNTGRIAGDNLMRVFGTARHIRIIAKHFTDLITGELDYFRLQNVLKQLQTQGRLTTRVTAKPELPPVFETLVRAVRAKAIDVRLNFSRADRLGTGKLQSRQFAAVVSSFGANLSPKDIENITNSFKGDDDLCSYLAFAQAIDEYHLPPLQATSAMYAIEPDVERALDPNDILRKVRASIHERRINPREFFDSRSCEGSTDRIPKSRFNRIIHSMRVDLSNDDIDKLSTLFEGPMNTVEYAKFLDTIDVRDPVQVCTADDVLPRLKDHLLRTRQSLTDSAARFDREGSGEISVAQLTSALQFVRFQITQPELAAIRDAFMGSRFGSVKWPDLCKAVDPTPEELGPTPYDLERDAIRNEESVPSSAAPPENVKGVVLKIAQACQKNKINIQEEFLYQDRRNRGVLSQQVFMSVLTSLPVNLAPSDIRVIIGYYRKTGESDINYVSLCKDSLEVLREAEVEASRPPPPPQPQPDPKMPLIPVYIHSFLKRFKQFAEQHRLNANSPFEQYDRNRSGFVQSWQVPACFNNVGFVILRDEADALVRVFRDVKRSEMFNYWLFAEAVDQEDIASEAVRAELENAPIPFAVERDAATTVGTIREKLLARRRNVRSAFDDLRTPTVTRTDFLRRLERLDIILKAGEIQAIIRRYRVNTLDQVDWSAFCTDVENSKTIG